MELLTWRTPSRLGVIKALSTGRVKGEACQFEDDLGFACPFACPKISEADTPFNNNDKLLDINQG